MREAVRTSDIHERGGPDIGHSCLYINCHVVIFAETMAERDFEKEQLMREIILRGSDDDEALLFLNDREDDGSGARTMEVEEHDHDGSGDRMPEGERDHDDGSGGRTDEGAVVAKSGEVYIIIKHVLTS